MEASIKKRIREFVLKGVDETPVIPQPDEFWQSLKNTGTELWLDTGDTEEAEKIWTAEMSALTTNNTLLNNEIQKGIYDTFIADAKKIVKDLPPDDQVKEIAFILNARHGLRLAKKFGGMVSVELHTGTAHDFEAIIDYGQRYWDICPEQFIVKVPYTATGLLGARKLKELGVRINFTLEFSARQNVIVASVAKPDYLNVFLGRLGAYIKNNGLGDGSGIGERAVLSAQKWIKKITKDNSTPTRLIAASLRSYEQLEALAGVDVFTMPVKVASDGKAKLAGNFTSRLNMAYPVGLNEDAVVFAPEKLWEVTDREAALAENLDKDLPQNGEELIRRCHKAGCGDLFPYLSEKDLSQIYNDGKIPVHRHWANRIVHGELAIDTLLNLAGLASFTADQAELDNRIIKIIQA